MQQAANAYAKTAQTTLSSRDLEAHVLMKSAARLQAIRDEWDLRQGELDGALTHNRKLWTVLLTAVTSDDNPLPAPIRQNVANLGIFIMNHTIGVMTAPAPEKLNVLVTINRELAAGLRASAAR
jgi:flagellar protein FlaF